LDEKVQALELQSIWFWHIHVAGHVAAVVSELEYVVRAFVL